MSDLRCEGCNTPLRPDDARAICTLCHEQALVDEGAALRAENEALKKERDELAAALDYWTRIVDELQCILPEVGGEPAAIAVRAALDAYVSDREAAVEAILATHDKAKDRKIAELTAAWKASVPRGKIPAPWEDRLDAILDARDKKKDEEILRLSLKDSTERERDELAAAWEAYYATRKKGI